MENDSVLVSIITLAYNHEQYIRQCLDGFIMQQTTFPFEVLIHDDASTDRTADIIREYQLRYPSIIKPIFQTENQYSKGIPIGQKYLYPKAKGAYIAECEGDDFWTDPKKLETQVNFLETHPEYGFIGTGTQILRPNGTTSDDIYDHYLPIQDKENGISLFKDVFDYAKNGPVARTASICFRRSIIEPYFNYIIGDLVLQTILAKHSFFASVDKRMTVYRSGVGISSTRLSFEKQLCYNDWFVKNRRMQMSLFPNDCIWDNNLLEDRGDYIRLKIMVRDHKWRQALRLKRQLRSREYKRKAYAKYLLGPISCAILSYIIKK